MKELISKVCIAWAVLFGAFFCMRQGLALEKGNQLYQLLAVLFLCFPGAMALLLARRRGIRLPLTMPSAKYLRYALLIPFLLLIASALVSLLTDSSSMQDTLLIAPIHELSWGRRFWRIFLVGTNMAALALLYAISINFVLGLGEELMWRGLFPAVFKSMPFWQTALCTGVLQGLWQMPLITLFGLFYPEHMVAGPLLMIAVSTLLAPLLLQLRLSSGSILASALFYGAFLSFDTLYALMVGDPDSLMSGMSGASGIFVLCFANIGLYIVRKKRAVFV